MNILDTLNHLVETIRNTCAGQLWPEIMHQISAIAAIGIENKLEPVSAQVAHESVEDAYWHLVNKINVLGGYDH